MPRNTPINDLERGNPGLITNRVNQENAGALDGPSSEQAWENCKSMGNCCSTITLTCLTPKQQFSSGVALIATGVIMTYFTSADFLLTSEDRYNNKGLPLYGWLGQFTGTLSIIDGVIASIVGLSRLCCCNKETDNTRVVEEGNNGQSPTPSRGSNNGSYQRDQTSQPDETLQPGTSTHITIEAVADNTSRTSMHSV